MNQIYTNTTQCLIWLGEIRPDIPLSDAVSALEIIRFMSENGTDGAADVAVPACLASAEAVIGPVKALQSIALHENEWWHRIWTLQEAVLPSKACVLWGPLIISWDALVRASNPNQYMHHLLAPHSNTMNALVSQVNGLEIAKRYRVEPMDTAFRWGFRKATNPLDKVYGLLGLYPRGTLRRAEACDYRLPAATLYAMFTADLIEHHRSLHPIALLTCKHLRDSTAGMPSWALDMGHREGTFADVPISMTPVGSSGDNSPWFTMNNYGWYNACGGSGIDWKCFRYDAGDNELILTGCFVDEISLVGAALESDRPGAKHVSDRSVIERIQDWHQRADAFYQSKQWPDHSHGAALWPESFWRGLVGNLVGDYLRPERPATESDIAFVRQFVQTGQRASICQEIFATMSHRKMFVTQGGFLGFGPRHLDVGDQVWILQGGLVPFVLRPCLTEASSNNRYQLIGPSYVAGIMEGEVAGEDRNSIITLI
ncbi:Heterokaryon incompatibility [Macrophomina phaseolina MS6]|uniref:Heterokaryon incompatibility n=1 Tax=Macrophomina phaseolina (strain MS6) TaxID=1126212 RepID=K2RU71_MACPH|nr:Heterokaryon incompatibility [Macrophomina phaseolina MS6]